MSPILGIWASQISGHTFTSDFESIATVTAGAGGSASLQFTSIPSTYKHLQIRYTVQSNRGTYSADNIFGTFNNDTGANYSYHFMRGDGLSSSSTQTTGNASNNQLSIGQIPSSVTASMFGVGVIDILNYSNTNYLKTTRAMLGYTENNAGSSTIFNNMYVYSNTWRSTAAINSIQFFPQSGTAFTQYSTFALYGIK